MNHMTYICINIQEKLHTFSVIHFLCGWRNEVVKSRCCSLELKCRNEWRFRCMLKWARGSTQVAEPRLLNADWRRREKPAPPPSCSIVAAALPLGGFSPSANQRSANSVRPWVLPVHCLTYMHIPSFQFCTSREQHLDFTTSFRHTQKQWIKQKVCYSLPLKDWEMFF